MLLTSGLIITRLPQNLPLNTKCLLTSANWTVRIVWYAKFDSMVSYWPVPPENCRNPIRVCARLAQNSLDWVLL